MPNKFTTVDKIFDNPLQAALSTQHQTYREEQFMSSKPVHTAPPIDHEEGDIYVLKNGNTILKEKYDSMWFPKRTKVKPYNHKGDNPHKTKV